jgi:hypothetical protein
MPDCQKMRVEIPPPPSRKALERAPLRVQDHWAAAVRIGREEERRSSRLKDILALLPLGWWWGWVLLLLNRRKEREE